MASLPLHTIGLILLAGTVIFLLLATIKEMLEER